MQPTGLKGWDVVVSRPEHVAITKLEANVMRIGLMLVLLLAAITVMFLTGCPKPVDEVAQQQEMESQIPPEQGEPAAGTDAEPAETTASSDFEWTETPTLDAIPDGAIVGMINGKPFTAATVRLKVDDEQTVLEISDQAVDEPTGMTMSDTGLDLRFTLEPGKAGELVLAKDDEKDFDREHAYYHYPQGGDKGPMSVNASWGCALQITDWTLEVNEEDEDILGNAKGKVAVIFGDDEKSWVAGTFDCVYYEW